MKMGDDPEWECQMMNGYPSDEFLKQAEKYLVCRYCTFLLQSLMLLLRNFQPPKLVENKFGSGVGTSARVALLVLQTTKMTPESMQNMRSIKRFLYARMLREGESRTDVESTLKEEWEAERESLLAQRIQKWLSDHLAPAILEGKFPKSNVRENMDLQWENHWKVLRAIIVICVNTTPMTSHVMASPISTISVSTI